MDSMTHDRWLEVSFYFFCYDILEEHNDIMDLMCIIEALAPIGKYEVEPLKALTQQILITYNLHPTREELAILMFAHGSRVEDIRRVTKLGKDKVYQLYHDNKMNPRMFIPRLTETQRALIEKFTDAMIFIRKAGIYK